MRNEAKIHSEHLSRKAYIYVRQSSPGQVIKNTESARRQRDRDHGQDCETFPHASLSLRGAADLNRERDRFDPLRRGGLRLARLACSVE